MLARFDIGEGYSREVVDGALSSWSVETDYPGMTFDKLENPCGAVLLQDNK